MVVQTNARPLTKTDQEDGPRRKMALANEGRTEEMKPKAY